jgi:ornithine carbamoyltransferase
MPNHFLAISDFSPAMIQQLLENALLLKKEWQGGGNRPLLKGKVLGMVFQKPSLRTRVSFDMAMRHLGGDALYLSPAEVGLGQRESVADVSRVLAGYVDAIMARVFDHAIVLEMSRYSRVPVINGLSDYNHPCQALADALTMREHFGSLAGRKVAFVGDGNNVACSLLHICMRLGVHFSIASPAGYGLSEEVLAAGEETARATGSRIELHRLPAKAAAGADVLYTDTWTSMGQEEETQRRMTAFAGYQINGELLSHASPGAVVLHCLPAHRGQEITDEVADGPHSLLFPQAENRMHAQKAILAYVFGMEV